MAFKMKPEEGASNPISNLNFITHPDQVKTGIILIISNVLNDYESIKKAVETLNTLKIFNSPVYIIDYSTLTDKQMDEINNLGYDVSRPFILLKRNGNEITRSSVKIDDSLFELLQKNNFISISKEQVKAIEQYLFEFKAADKFSNKIWYLRMENFQNLCEAPFSEISKFVALVIAEKIMSIKDSNNQDLLIRSLLNASGQSENAKTIAIWTIGALLERGFQPSNFPRGESALLAFLTEPLNKENENAKFAAVWSLVFFLSGDKFGKIKRDDEMVENIANTLNDFISSKEYKKQLLGVVAFRVFSLRFGISEDDEFTINKICDLLSDLKEREPQEGEQLKIQEIRELKKQIASALGTACLSFKINEESDTGKNIIDSFATLLKDEDKEVIQTALDVLAQVANTELNSGILQFESIKEAIEDLKAKGFVSPLFTKKRRK